MNDHWDPYLRRSTRSSDARKQRVITTPPPAESKDASSHHPRSGRGKLGRNLSHTMSPPPSTKSSPKDFSSRNLRENGNEYTDQAALIPGNLTSAPTNTDKRSNTAQSHDEANTMLPTPAKTPVKRPAKSSAGVQSTARILFRPASVDDVMPANKRRKNGRHVGFTLDSFDGTDGQGDEDIKIYTDSKERVPELDPNEDNPFWDGDDKVVVPVAPKKAGKGKKLSSELSGMVGREDGYVATL